MPSAVSGLDTSWCQVRVRIAGDAKVIGAPNGRSSSTGTRYVHDFIETQVPGTTNPFISGIVGNLINLKVLPSYLVRSSPDHQRNLINLKVLPSYLPPHD
jgi:hypothetical protein